MLRRISKLQLPSTDEPTALYYRDLAETKIAL
jgi:hypothetical protein